MQNRYGDMEIIRLDNIRNTYHCGELKIPYAGLSLHFGPAWSLLG